MPLPPKKKPAAPARPVDPFFGAGPTPEQKLARDQAALNAGDVKSGMDLGELRNYLVRQSMGGKPEEFLTTMRRREANEMMAGGDRARLGRPSEGDLALEDKGHNAREDAELAANAQQAQQRMAQGSNGGLFDGIRAIASQLAPGSSAPSAAEQAGPMAGAGAPAQQPSAGPDPAAIQAAIDKLRKQPEWDKVN